MVESSQQQNAETSDDELEEELEESSPLVARIGRFGGVALAAVALGCTHPALGGLGGLSSDASWVLALLALMATWWVTLAVEPALTGLVPFVLLSALSIGKPVEIAAPYADDVMFLFGGGALLALGLERTGVSARFATLLVRIAGSSPLRVLAAVMVGSALISAFVSNLATAATMLPMAVALGARARAAAPDDAMRAAAERFTTSLLLGVAFGSSIGGALTIIGSPPNPIAVKWLVQNGVEMDFVRWLRFSVPTTLVFLPLAIAILGVWLFPTRGLVVPPETQASQPIGRDGFAALCVFALAVCAWVTQPLYKPTFPGVKDGTIAIAAATLLFLIPSTRGKRKVILDPSAFAKVPWRVLVLFGGGLCLAEAMQRSGLSQSLGSAIHAAGVLPPLALLAILVAVLVFASEVASNTTLTAMAVPIVGALAPGLGIAPEKLVVPAVFAASWAFALPVGTPPNALVFASGRVRARDMMRAGIVLDFVSIAVIVVMSSILL